MQGHQEDREAPGGSPAPLPEADVLRSAGVADGRVPLSPEALLDLIAYGTVVTDEDGNVVPGWPEDFSDYAAREELEDGD